MPFVSTPRAAALVLALVPAVAAAQQGDRPAARKQAGQNQQPATNQAEDRPAADAPPAPSGGDANFKTFDEKLSYVLGVNTARRMQQDNVEPDPQSFARGFIDTFTKDEPLLTEDEMAQVLEEFRVQLQEKAEKALTELAGQWNEAFAEDAKPEGEPKATKSGLKYEAYEQGEGPKPKATDVVAVHYVGKFEDGKVFDSSIARGEPAVFPLSGPRSVIEGWKEALQLMPTGSRYKLYVPSKLAYGETGFGNVIPPNRDLIFEIELLEIIPPQGEAPEAPEEEAPQGQPEE